MIEGVARKRGPSQFAPVGVAYIMIPSNVEREEYISNCYQRERVCILLEQGGSMVKDCYISQQALKDIYFPKTNEGLGSAVIFVAQGFNNKPMIVSTVSKEDETDLLTEHKFKLEKFYENNGVIIEGNAEKGVLNIFVDDKNEYGVVNLSIKGKEGGVLNVDTSGKVNVNADGEVNAQSSGKINLKTIESSSGDVKCEVNINGEDVSIKPENELKIGEFTEPVALADTLADILDRLVTEISNSLVSTSLGAQPLLNKAQIVAFKQELDTIKSEVTKTS